jgi:hypothetical protein
MVEVVLSEGQLACLKAAVTVGSEESWVLGRSVRIGSQLFSSAKFVVKCRREIAMRLLSVAERSCSDVAPGIRAALDHEKQ